MLASKSRGRLAARLAAGIAAATLFASGAIAQEPVELVFWTWLPNIQTTVDKFEAANPGITVKVENVGVGTDQYTKMQNAVDAGSGGPDVAHMTYDAIPNFALTGALADVTQYGGESVKDIFLPGVVGLVDINGGIYGIPQDFGPGVMYYRKDVFDAAGVEVPSTWAEFAAAAEAIHANNPDHYITFIDAGLVDAAYMGLWQLSAEPWTITDGTNVTVNLQSDKAKQWADYWTDLNNKGLLIDGTMGADEWFKNMADGKMATWVVGAWGLQALTGVLPQNDGLWRVAPQPVWNEGDVGTSQFGGSANVVMANSTKKEAAVKFALWMNGSPEGVASLKDDQGLLPTTNAAWEDPAFIGEEIAYLGGQKAREIFAASARDSVVGWTWLPFQPYVSSVYKDTVGQAIAGKTSIFDGLKAWQDRIVQYAQEQGFTVTAQ